MPRQRIFEENKRFKVNYIHVVDAEGHLYHSGVERQQWVRKFAFVENLSINFIFEAVQMLCLE
jgi:hypothetical protein